MPRCERAAHARRSRGAGAAIARAELLPPPSQGFVAKPQTLPDGSQDLLNWEVVIPGKDGTIWEGARIPMSMCAETTRRSAVPCPLAPPRAASPRVTAAADARHSCCCRCCRCNRCRCRRRCRRGRRRRRRRCSRSRALHAPRSRRVFTEDYPNKPPMCKFKLVANTGKPLFHPNVYPSGKICLSLLDAEKSWKPSLTIKHLLIGIQTLLDDPNNADPAQEEPYKAYKSDRKEYEARVKQQVALLKNN